MLRLATAQDRAGMEAFLARHAESSMFLRSNLAAHGTDERVHPHGTRFYIWSEPDSETRSDFDAVFGITNHGFLLVQAPNVGAGAYHAFASAVAGAKALGMTGPDDQVSKALGALGLSSASYQLNHSEPLYRLDLSRLPAQSIPMRPPNAQDLPVLQDWFAGYLVETQQNTVETAAGPARTRAEKAIADQSISVLLDQDDPVAMAAINARVADHVQVGGVFVPGEHRNKGLGRRVTAGVLQQAAKDGAKTAILFANNPPAARAYEALGFEYVGQFRVAFLKDATRIAP